MTVCMTVRFVGWLQRICIAAGEGGLVGCAILYPPRFFGSLLREACVPPIEGSSRFWGATAKAVEGPTSKPSPSEFVVPVVVPGA